MEIDTKKKMTQKLTEIYCTICSKRKKSDKIPIPAIELYDSPRIKSIYQKSKRRNIPFRILSAKYGLIQPNETILNYDVLLTPKLSSKLKQTIQKQLDSQNISSIRFFAKDAPSNPRWKPYLKLLKEVCNENNIELELERIK